MKRVFSLLLAALMLLTLAACGGSGEADATSSIAQTDSAETNAPETQASETQAAETEPSETEASEDEEAMLGSLSGSVYTNTFLGFQCALDENWTVADEEYLGQLSGIVADEITDEDLAELIRSSGTVYAFYAYAEEGLVSMNICLENLGLLYGAVLSEEDYVDISLEQIGPALESMGMSEVTAEAETISFAGADHAGIRIHGTYSGVDFYELMICVKSGSYMSAITLASYYEDLSETMLAMYSAAE